MKVNKQLREIVVDIRETGFGNDTQKLARSVPRKFLGVSFEIHDPIENWTAREIVELEVFGITVPRNGTNRSDAVNAMGIELLPVHTLIGPFLTHRVAPTGSMHNISMSSVEEGIAIISMRKL